jgi:hypothetical protein
MMGGMMPELFRGKVTEKAMGHVGLRELLCLIADRLYFVLDDIHETAEPVIASAPGLVTVKDLPRPGVIRPERLFPARSPFGGQDDMEQAGHG